MPLRNGDLKSKMITKSLCCTAGSSCQWLNCVLELVRGPFATLTLNIHQYTLDYISVSTPEYKRSTFTATPLFRDVSDIIWKKERFMSVGQSRVLTLHTMPETDEILLKCSVVYYIANQDVQPQAAEYY